MKHTCAGCSQPVHRHRAKCAHCRDTTRRANRARNKPKNRENATQLKRQMSNTAKGVPCLDCGEAYPPFVMDFDHRIGVNKLFNISEIVTKRGCTVTMLKAEIAKCDVVCANCHRMRTHSRLVLT